MHVHHRATIVPAAVLTAVLALSACGGSEPGDTGSMPGMEGSTPSSSSATSGSPSADAGAGEGFNDEDVAFAQMMSVHHAQAIEMSDVLLAEDGIEGPVTGLAEQIKTSQAPEIEQMTALLEGWGAEVPATDAGSMEGMDHGGGTDHGGSTDTGGMPGMMTEEDMTALDAAGPEASRLFLEMMTEHHTGAVEMAQSEVDAGADPEAIALAETIITSQESEIAQMQDLLASL